jgi:hypothetical protein
MREISDVMGKLNVDLGRKQQSMLFLDAYVYEIGCVINLETNERLPKLYYFRVQEQGASLSQFKTLL